MTNAQTDRRHLYQTIALAASALGLFIACGMGARPSMPATPTPPPPPANLSISAEVLTFDRTVVNTRSPIQQVIFTNNDTESLTFVATDDRYRRIFHIDSNTCTGPISPGQSCTVTFSFRPEHVGKSYAGIDFFIRDHRPTTVHLVGEGIPRRPHSLPPNSHFLLPTSYFLLA